MSSTDGSKKQPHRFEKGNPGGRLGRKYKTRYNKRFLEDLQGWWDRKATTSKGLPARDPITGQMLPHVTNGQQLIDHVARKHPAAFLKTCATMAGHMTPKEVRADIGENLVSYLEQLNDRDRRISGNVIDGQVSTVESLPDKVRD